MPAAADNIDDSCFHSWHVYVCRFSLFGLITYTLCFQLFVKAQQKAMLIVHSNKPK